MADESIKAQAREFILNTDAGQYASEAMLDAYSTDFATFARKVADDENRDLRERLEIAIEIFTDIRDMPYYDQDNEHRLRYKATQALTKLQEKL